MERHSNKWSKKVRLPKHTPLHRIQNRANKCMVQMTGWWPPLRQKRTHEPLWSLGKYPTSGPTGVKNVLCQVSVETVLPCVLLETLIGLLEFWTSTSGMGTRGGRTRKLFLWRWQLKRALGSKRHRASRMGGEKGWGPYALCRTECIPSFSYWQGVVL